MAQPNIRWRSKDERELRRVVNNFNRKLARVSKNNPGSIPFLPEKLSVREIRKTVKTRSDFNKKLSSARRFSERGSERVITTKQGISTTKYAKREAGIAKRSVNIKRTLERKRRGITDPNSREAIDLNLTPKEKTIENFRSQKAFDKYLESLEKEAQRGFKDELFEQYKQNYIDSLKNQFGDNVDDLIQEIEKLDPEQLFEQVNDNSLLNFEWIYDEEQSEGVVEERLRSEWQFTLGSI